MIFKDNYKSFFTFYIYENNHFSFNLIHLHPHVKSQNEYNHILTYHEIKSQKATKKIGHTVQ